MTDVSTATQMTPGIVGALGTGGGVIWLARLLFKRTLDGYDKALDAHAKRHDEATKTLTEMAIKLAVLETKLDSSFKDIGVAHRRIEALAGGNNNISEIQTPTRGQKT